MSLEDQIKRNLGPTPVSTRNIFVLNHYIGPANLNAGHRATLENFLRPMFRILRAAIDAEIPHMAQAYQGWDFFISRRSWHIIPLLSPAIRLCNEFERVHADPITNQPARGLGIWKVCPCPFRNVPCIIHSFSNLNSFCAL